MAFQFIPIHSNSFGTEKSKRDIYLHIKISLIPIFQIILFFFCFCCFQYVSEDDLERWNGTRKSRHPPDLWTGA